jgi:hypothetical protein
MKQNNALRGSLLAGGIVLAAVFAVGDAHAQKAGGSDKEMATKKGMDALATKEFDKNKLPGTLEVGLALGSIGAVIAAMKWL